MEVEIRTRVFPTEDVEKLRRSLASAFNSEFEFRDGVLISTTKLESLEKMKSQIKSREIQPTVKELILKFSEDGKVRLLLNKQAICRGIFNFVDEEEFPLGVIEVTIWMSGEELISFLEL
ncbi:MAG: RNA-binding domain-containing protein [Candidatus Nanoarchaeia archaeon]|nr:hypothetical protein [Candidatus Haiyanarchaeum thermophilum]MCW1303251.1 hypothetical protein [Candidatus Haiyanarchaeum thermophilum]MCW1304017.1 hypothetical protein [Candidatus Haiyanarchaeum thermophilum]MCW1306411.1 hypothetical protein [Candidatus Haiyanarchaeum thermophilum]MCW1307291.1 hypothetical protein [Candidatus Haiyanarchaeum thermophilum]